MKHGDAESQYEMKPNKANFKQREDHRTQNEISQQTMRQQNKKMKRDPMDKMEICEMQNNRSVNMCWRADVHSLYPLGCLLGVNLVSLSRSSSLLRKINDWFYIRKKKQFQDLF